MYYHSPDPIRLVTRLQLNFFILCSVMKQCFMFYVLPFAQLNPFSTRQKLKLVFDATFLHERMIYVLCFTIYLTKISMPLDQSCAYL